MVQYVVQVFVDADRMLNEVYKGKQYHKDGEKKWKQLKGWDGKSPLYGAGKSYATRLVFDLAKAQAVFMFQRGPPSMITILFTASFSGIKLSNYCFPCKLS